MSPQQLGEVIRKVRKRQGLTQPQLAGAAGVGLRFLVELEGGKGTSHLGKAVANCTVLTSQFQNDLFRVSTTRSAV